MKKAITTTLLFTLLLCSLTAQTCVWKDGHPLVTDPDSITFVKPDMSAQIISQSQASGDCTEIHFLYPGKDYQGNPIWLSAQLLLTKDQVESKHISKMAMYNHYTIASSAECPTCGMKDLQLLLPQLRFAVVAADYEGFGETGDRVQAYCLGEANARASIDALLAAREWLRNEGYSLSDSIINYGYSQGGQTTVAAVKLSQSEYRGKVHFMKSFAGAGPYNLRLTYRKFEEWEKIGQPSVLPLTIVTMNELMNMGLKYTDVFKAPLSQNVKSWIISKKFDTNELKELFGSDSIKYFMQPVYMDSTSEQMAVVLKEVDKQRLSAGWTPDADTEIKLYHSLKDDIVAPENSIEMYNYFISKGATKAELDTSSLTDLHTPSGIQFGLKVLSELIGW